RDPALAADGGLAAARNPRTGRAAGPPAFLTGPRAGPPGARAGTAPTARDGSRRPDRALATDAPSALDRSARRGGRAPGPEQFPRIDGPARRGRRRLGAPPRLQRVRTPCTGSRPPGRSDRPVATPAARHPACPRPLIPGELSDEANLAGPDCVPRAV